MKENTFWKTFRNWRYVHQLNKLVHFFFGWVSFNICTFCLASGRCSKQEVMSHVKLLALPVDVSCCSSYALGQSGCVICYTKYKPQNLTIFLMTASGLWQSQRKQHEILQGLERVFHLLCLYPITEFCFTVSQFLLTVTEFRTFKERAWWFEAYPSW